MIGLIGTSLQLRSIITLYNQSWPPRPLFILLLVLRLPANNLRCPLWNFGTDQAQKTHWGHRYPSNSSIVIGVCLRSRLHWTSVIVVTPVSGKAFTKQLPSNGYPRYYTFPFVYTPRRKQIQLPKRCINLNMTKEVDAVHKYYNFMTSGIRIFAWIGLVQVWYYKDRFFSLEGIM
jgi:hypothetical protein